MASLSFLYFLTILLSQIVQSTIINEGKFFYANMRSGVKPSETTKRDPIGMLFVDVLVSNQNEQF